MKRSPAKLDLGRQTRGLGPMCAAMVFAALFSLFPVSLTSANASVTAAAAPASPTGLTVNAGVRSVSMKWTASTDTSVTGVRVLWGTSPSALTNQFTVAGRTVESFVHSGSPVRVINKSLTSNVAALTTDVAHGLIVGDFVFISGVDVTFDGTYVVKSKTLTTFTYDRVATNVTATALATTGSAQKSQSLGIGQTYYYQIAYIYTDNTQACAASCLSAFSATVSALTQFTSSTRFAYTGGVQSYVVPAGVDSLQVDAFGANGGATTFAAGLGGRVEAVVPVTPGEVLFMYVGAANSSSTGGWNGGASGTLQGLGGGGASDIRRGISISSAALVSGTATITTSTAHGLTAGTSVVVAGVSASFNGTYTIASVPTTTKFTYSRTGVSDTSVSSTGGVIPTLPASSWARRILVAGGGGGATSWATGGSGGGLVASVGGAYSSFAGGVAGTQSTGNALGVGGAGTTHAGGGGGGYWGGGGGSQYAGGGGGSSFTSTGIYGVIHTLGSTSVSGDGSIRISLPLTTTMPTPSQLVGTGWSRTSELTWATPGVNDVTGYRVKWGTDPSNIVYQFDVAGGSTTSFTHSGNPIAISSKAMTTTVATLTTSADHGLSVGQEVAITGVDSTFNGIYVVTAVPTARTFTYALSGTAVSATAITPTGLMQRTNNLILGQNYYYKIAAMYTDATQTCGSLCLSSFTAASTVVGRFGVQTSFDFNDGVSTYKVPSGVSQIQVDAQGAQGSNITTFTGGKGGRVQASVPVTPGETLFVYVGGGGGSQYPFSYKDPTAGGRNGGGVGTGTTGGGGGATDIRRGFSLTNAELTNNFATLTTSEAHGFAIGNVVVVTGLGATYDGSFAVTAVTTNTFSYAKTNANVATSTVDGAVLYSNPALGLSRRVVVAGGGGGASAWAIGGNGGGLVAVAGGVYGGNAGGVAGTQSTGNALGLGGTGAVHVGGGGGGYWGGGGGEQYTGGGGGSSFTTSNVVFVRHTQAYRSGDGRLTVTTAQSSTIATPTDLAVLGSDRQNYASWTASTNTETEGYRIKWGTSSGALTNIIDVAGGSVNEYLHTNLTMGTRYYYAIAAKYSDLNSPCQTLCLSDFSSEVSEITRFSPTNIFDFTETIQSYRVPVGVTQIRVDAQGGKGGQSGTAVGGLGGRVQATLAVTPGEVLFAFVGGGGGDNHPAKYQALIIGGWNGGGAGIGVGGGGGGATDLRRGTTVTNAALTSSVALLTTSAPHGLVVGNSFVVAGVGAPYDGTFTATAVTTNTVSYALVNVNVTSASVNGALIRNATTVGLSDRLFVAGGGGGTGNNAGTGGAGGGLSAGEGSSNSCSGGVTGNCSGLGATQTYGNAVGIGGAGAVTNAGGGGGGYYGGYGSGQNPQQWRTGTGGYSGGGGGSSWTQSSARFVSHTQGFRTGNGALVIYAPQTGSLDAPRNFEVYGYQAFNVLNWTPSPESAVTGYRVAWGTSQGVLSQFINIPGRLSQSFLHHGNNFAVTNKSIATNVATLTTSSNHGIAIGDEFIVQGVGTPFDGTYVAASGTTGTTLKYSLINANISTIAVSPTGNVSKTKALTINTTYYYEVTALYADASRTCNTSCESASSSQRYATPIFTRDVSFTSNGNVQTFTVPDGVTWLQVDAVGASGGTGATGIGGRGSRVQGVIPVTPGEVLYAYIGGKGGGSLVATQNVGGWNGGGNGSGAGVGGGGGGATDIRRNKLVVTTKSIASNVAILTTALEHGFSVGDTVIVADVGAEFNGTFVATTGTTGTTLKYSRINADISAIFTGGTVSGPSTFATAASLATRVVVAGGGGGGGNDRVGGVGGGLTAGEGGSNSCATGVTGNCSGLGGSQTYGKSLGLGGVGTVAYSGGGGGGYWGGWAAGNTPQLDRTATGGYSGGGGGSSYTATEVAAPVHTQGYQTGAGTISLSYSIDNSAPVVTAISSPNPTGNYILGKEISINVAYSEAVVVSGTPTLTLDAGTRDVVLNYVSGSGSSTLLFTYVVAQGDLKTQLDIKSTDSLVVSSGLITDRVGNIAVNTLPTPGSTTSLVGSKLLAVDGDPPLKPTVLSASGVDGISLDWADNTESDLQEYRIYSCSGLVASSCSSPSTFSVLSSVATGTSTFDHVAVGRGITYYYYVTAVDRRGNEGPASDVVSWFLPVPVLVATPSVVAVSPTNDLTPEITGVADAGATVYLYLDGSTTPLGSVVAASTGTYAFSPSSNISAGSHTFRARATVVGTKTGSSGFSNEQIVLIDTTAPTFSSNNRSYPTTQTTGLDVITFRWTFSEAVSGLDTSDIAVSGSTATASSVSLVSGLTGVYDITVSGGDLAGYNGVVGIGFISSPTVTDIAGNALSSTTPASAAQTYTMDNSFPPVTITSSALTLGGASTATLTFTLGQSSTDFVLADIDATGGTLSTFTGSGTSYTATFTPRSGFSGSAVVSVDAGAFSNASGIYNSAGSLSLTVDTTAPSILSLQSPTSNGIYKAAATINVTVTFDETLVAATGGGVPTLLLETGAVDRTATFVSSSGPVATFRYVVQAGDVSGDLDVQSPGALALNGGTIKDAAGNAANLAVIAPGTTGSLGLNAAIVVDTIAPVAPSSLLAIGVGGVTVNNKLTSTNTDLSATATIVAGEATGGTATLYLDGVSIATDSTISVTDTTVSFVLGKTTTAALQSAITAGGILTAKLTDAAGNLSSPSTTVALSCDYVVPTIQLSSSRSTLIAGQTATITATLSESSTSFTSADVSATGGLISGFTGSGGFYSFVFTPASSSTTPMSVQVLAGVFSDAFGNMNTASPEVTATVDTVLPTVSGVSSLIANGSYRAGTALDITVTFTKNVVVTTAAGTPTVLMATGATARLASYVSGSGTSVLSFRYVVQAGDVSSDLDIQSSGALLLNGGFIKDVSGNNAARTLANPGASGSLGLAKAIVIDTIAPSAPTTLVVTPAGGTVVANTLLADNTNMTASATIVAGQATGGWAELVLGSTTIATDVSIASGDTSVSFDLNFSVAADLQAAIAAGGQLTVRVIDAAGNISSSSQATTLTVDYIKPSATLSSSRSTLKIGETATVTVRLSKASSTFALISVSVTGGTLGTFVPVSSTQYTFVFTPTSGINSGSASLSIASGAFTDTAGNSNTATSTLSMSYDTVAPSVPVVSGTSPVITNDATPTLSGTAEAGSTVVVSDSSTTPSTVLARLIATNGTWSFDASTLDEGSHLVSAVAIDATGNASASSTAKTWQIDTTPPTVSFPTVAGNDSVTRAKKDAGVTISGSAESGASVVLQFAGLSKAITLTSGTWEYSLTTSDWTAIGSASPVAFLVTATDSASNTASRTRNVLMNLADIAVPGNPDLNSADDTGDSTDNVTTKRTIRINVALVITGTPSHEVGQLLQLIDDTGVTLASHVLVSADITAGVYQFTLQDLNDDTYVLQSRISNLGNSAISAGQLTVQVDNRVPGTPGAPNMTDATDSGISARDNVTSDPRPIFSVAIDGIEISGERLVVGDRILLYNGSSIVHTRALLSADLLAGSVAIQPDNNFSEGANILTAKAQSIAGVRGESSVALSIVVDTTAQSSPTAPDLVTADDTGASSSDNITSVTQPNFSVTLAGLGVVANDQIQLLNAAGQVIGTATVSSIDVANGTVLVSPLASFTDGTQVVKVRIVDRAGNVGAISSTLAITNSTNIPNATSPGLQGASDSGRSSSDRVTQRTTPTFTGTGTSGDTVKLFSGSQLLGTTQVAAGTWSIAVSALTDGSYTLRALVIDNAGNESSFSSGLGITVDTLRPVAPAITGAPLLSRTATPVISGTAEAFAIVNLYEGLHLIGTTTADGLGNWTLTASSLVDQSYSLKASATDIAGNTSTDSASVSLLVDTITPSAPTVNSIITYSLAQGLGGSGEPGATLTIYDGTSSIGTVTISAGGTWSFVTSSLTNASHVFTAVQTDAVGNTSALSAPARTASSLQMSALYGANGIDDNGIRATASQYGADGITDINTAAKASLLNDVIDVLPTTAVDTQAEIAALAAIVKSIFATAAGENVVPALTPQDLAALGITGVNSDNIDSVIAAIAGTADSGSGVDSLIELSTLVDTTLAASRTAISIISNFDGSNTVPSQADFSTISVSRVTASNISSVNSVLAVLPVDPTDSRAEVQSIVDTYVAILNAADGIANDGLSLTSASYQNIGLTDISSSSRANLLSSILDKSEVIAVDTYSELQVLANIVARLFVTAAGGNPVPPLTAAELALIGITGVTTSNLSSVLSTIAATSDNGSGIDALAKLQAVVDTGIENARIASLAIIANFDGTNIVPTLADFVNIGVAGVTSSQIAAINTFIAVKPAPDTDSQVDVQAVIDTYAKIVTSANGFADDGVPLSAVEFAVLGLSSVDSAGEVSLLNELIDIRPGTAVDSYAEVAALASIVTRLMGEAAGVPSSPALLPSDFAALGVSGVTAENLAEVLIAIRASADSGSEIDTVTELRALVDTAVALSRQNAIERISRYDGTSVTTTPTLSDFVNAGATGVSNVNLLSINSAFAEIGIADSNTTEDIQGLVSGYVSILLGADGQRDGDTSLSASDYLAMSLTRIDSSGKANLLSEIFDGLSTSKVDTYIELRGTSDVVADIFLVASGAQSQSELTTARFDSIGLSGITNVNVLLVVESIANSSDDTLGVDSFAELQAIVNQVRSSQASALAVISAYDGTNVLPTLNTFHSAGIVGVDNSNIEVIHQYLITMSVESTDSVSEVQALVDALLKLTICADGIANNNCTFTAAEFHAMGYLEIDTQEEIDALNIELDSLNLTPTREAIVASEAVRSVIDRFRPAPSPEPATPDPATPSPETPVTTTTVATPVTTTTVAKSVTTTTVAKSVTTTTVAKSVTTTTAPAVSIVSTSTTTMPVATTLPQLEVLPESGGVLMAPGKAAVVINGTVVDLAVVVNEDNSATIEYPGKFVVKIVPTGPEDSVVEANGNTLLRIYRNRTVLLLGEGFASNTEIEVWMNSTPTNIGTVITNADGGFSQSLSIPPGIELGEHTLTLSGELADGTMSKSSIGAIVVDVAEVPVATDNESAGQAAQKSSSKGGVPFDPQSEPKSVVSLLGDMAGLMALAGIAVSGRRREEDDDEGGPADSDEEERGSGDISDVSVKQHSTSAMSKADVLRPPRSTFIDQAMTALPLKLARVSPLVGRVLIDGIYLRSLFGVGWLLMPLLGVVAGVGSAFSTDFDAVMPSVNWLIAIVIIGSLDAFAGYMSASVFGVLVIVGGGVHSADSIRGLLGIWVFSFAVPMLASASRPFRRKGGEGIVAAWDRTADFVMIVLFGAWAVGSMFSSLPGLTGFRPSYAGDVSRIQLVVLAVLILRYALENLSTFLTPTKLLEFSTASLPKPGNIQIVISSIIRTASFAFVAIVFIGNNWALWTGAALYLIPKLADLVNDKFPNIESLHRYMPRGILKVTFMMFVARWWGQLLASNIDDAEKMLTFGFVFLGMPGFIATALGWFGRSSSQPWKQNWFTRIGGLILLVVGFLIVRGVLLG